MCITGIVFHISICFVYFRNYICRNNNNRRLAFNVTVILWSALPSGKLLKLVVYVAPLSIHLWVHSNTQVLLFVCLPSWRRAVISCWLFCNVSPRESITGLKVQNPTKVANRLYDWWNKYFLITRKQKKMSEVGVWKVQVVSHIENLVWKFHERGAA